MRLLREACGVPFGLPAREWMLEIGAALMRTETELILKSRRVVPGRPLEHGFRFKFPNWDVVARDLCDQSRRLHGIDEMIARVGYSITVWEWRPEAPSGCGGASVAVCTLPLPSVARTVKVCVPAR